MKPEVIGELILCSILGAVLITALFGLLMLLYFAVVSTSGLIILLFIPGIIFYLLFLYKP